MSIVRTTTWLVIGRLITALSAIVITPILARKLIPTDYGLYKQIDLAAMLLGPFLIFGLDKSVTYFVPRKGSRPVVEITTPICAILAVSGVMILVSVLFPDRFASLIGINSYRLLVLTTTVYAIASSISMVAGRSLIAAGSPGLAAMIPPSIGVPRSLALLVVALFFPRLDVVLATILVVTLIQTSVWLAALHRKELLDPPPSLSVLKRHIRYSAPLAVTALMQTWGSALDRYLVSSTLPPAIYAVYANGKTRVPLIPILTAALRDATAPRYSKLESEGRHRDMASLWRTTTESMLPVGILVSTFLSTTAQWSVPLYYGPKYLDSIPIFQVFAFSLLIRSLVGIGPILRALSAFRMLFITAAVDLGIRIAAGLIALRYGSLVTLTVVQLLITATGILVQFAYVRWRLDVPWSALVPTRALAVSIPCALLGWAITYGIGAGLGQRPLLALLAALGAWGLILVSVLWWQGTLPIVLSKFGLDRFGRRRSP